MINQIDPQITTLINLGTKTTKAKELRLEKLSKLIKKCYESMLQSDLPYHYINLEKLSQESQNLLIKYFTHNGFVCESCDNQLLIKY